MMTVKIRMCGSPSPFFAFGYFVLAYGKKCGQKLVLLWQGVSPMGTDLKAKMELLSRVLVA